MGNQRRLSHPAPGCGSAHATDHAGPAVSMMLSKGLYLITPDEPDPRRLLARVVPLLRFASCLQLRSKVMSVPALRDAGASLRDACRESGVPFIVNDDATLAAELGADGVHL